MSTPILVYNRLTGALETEKVYGRRWMELCYGHALGRRIGAALLARRPVSAAYGRLQQRSSSRRKIPAFIDQYDIDLDQVVVPPGGFASFNDFFIRRLKPQARPVDPDPLTFISPADSRLTVLDLHGDTPIRVKGMALHLPGLLGLPPHRTPWDGGTVLVFRLAPCDYHRFGYAVDGVQGAVHSVEGPFHSVNPLAMAHKPDTLMTNFRQWALVYSPQWGTVLQVEVGAMMVGSIVQQMPRGGPCRRGQEKGYFQFGGSTVVVVLEPDRIAVDDDIREQSSMGIETLVQYGEAVGTSTSA